MSKMVRTAIRMPKTFVKEGQKIAKAEGMSFATLVRRSLAREFLSRKEKP